MKFAVGDWVKVYLGAMVCALWVVMAGVAFQALPGSCGSLALAVDVFDDENEMPCCPKWCVVPFSRLSHWQFFNKGRYACRGGIRICVGVVEWRWDWWVPNY